MNVSEVYIYGDKYKIKTEGDEEYIKDIASFVELRMKEIEKNLHVLTTSKIAVMAAFNIAAEYFMLKEEISESKKAIEKLERKLDELEVNIG
ncbi:MAG: cell division protein ZapA [Flexistipes sinusarabici]|uniref:Cell division protein ZapA n=1 Tax=Flexistipes sinusarabici TaxID=2352 RepID=A0A5D0MQ65_FLESI|nr:cell division protein ZapA [Flexistipes sinusarabici]TYB32859.1 MAG: cell division protein ZapA [Flexistipes sinusarabici]